MNAPFYKYGLFNDEVSLIIAFFIGIGFGFFLERAGFGNSVKLAAQFYFYDMSVLKVMFSAIVTTMLGLYYLSVIGWVDLSLVHISPTYLIPQITGGLLLGVGFVIGGYCPGTSCVAASTGKLDGILYMAGIFVGIFIFGEIFMFIKNFYYSTPFDSLTIPQLLNLDYGLVVFLVALMAIGAFALAEWSENKFNKKII